MIRVCDETWMPSNDPRFRLEKRMTWDENHPFFYLKHWWSSDDLSLWRNTDGFWWSTFWTWNIDGHWWYVFILKYGWLLSIRISGEILIAFLKKCSSFAFGQIVSSTLSPAENCLLALRTPSLVPPTLLLSPHWNYP